MHSTLSRSATRSARHSKPWATTSRQPTMNSYFSQNCHPTKWQAHALKAETLAQIDAAHILMGHHFVRAALHQQLAIMHDVGAVDDLQRLANVVIGNQHAEAAILQMTHQVTDLAHRDGI